MKLNSHVAYELVSSGKFRPGIGGKKKTMEVTKVPTESAPTDT